MAKAPIRAYEGMRCPETDGETEKESKRIIEQMQMKQKKQRCIDREHYSSCIRVSVDHTK